MDEKKKKYRIKPTKITPYVEYVPFDGFLKITGRSSPASSVDFYRPILNTIKKHSPRNNEFIAEFRMEYFNTSSSQCIYDIFKELMNYKKQGISVRVNWYYEDTDEDMLETGEDFEYASGLTFNYIPFVPE